MYTENCFHLKCFLWVFLEFSRLPGEGLVESPDSNVTGKTSAFYNSFGNFVKCIGMFQKVALPLISRKSILTRLASLQSTGCNTYSQRVATLLETNS